MKSLVSKILVGVAVSMFLFPFSFSFLPAGLNVKMILAVIGGAIYVLDCAQKQSAYVSLGFIGTAFISVIFSLVCYYSALYNNTDDYSYATYFASLFTWMGGAYAVCRFIRWVHGQANMRYIVYYLAAVSVAQCILALLIDTYPAVKFIVDRYIVQGAEFMNEVNRLYGIGASLDPAGTRFAVILLLIVAVLIYEPLVRNNKKVIVQLLLCYFLIIVIGNMISRTTSVGVMLSVPLALLGTRALSLTITSRYATLYSAFSLCLLLAVFASVYLYNTSPDFKADMRFAFEGFFNWAETGTWSTSSTDKLSNEMWIWPEDMKTWIIGSGRFGGFIYSTDIGYCRFILYCGLVGFSIFAFQQIYNGLYFAMREKEYRLLFLFLIVISFTIWIKVATDIFQFYALFYCLDKIKPTMPDENYLYNSRNT